MALEDILKALEDKAEMRIEGILRDAQQQVKEIKAGVEKEADRTRRLRLKKVEDAIRSESTSIIYAASLDGKKELIKAQEETVEEAFKIADERLKGFHDRDEYQEIFEGLLEECLELLDGEVVLQVREDDRETAKKLMAKRKRPFTLASEALEASGGLMASSADGEIIVRNTLESRLEKARDKLKLEIANTLFGR